MAPYFNELKASLSFLNNSNLPVGERSKLQDLLFRPNSESHDDLQINQMLSYNPSLCCWAHLTLISAEIFYIGAGSTTRLHLLTATANICTYKHFYYPLNVTV